jgi:hypothetical protein
MEYNDPDIQLYRRSMGYPFNPEAVQHAVNNGMAGPRRTYEEPKYKWPEYDGTDSSTLLGGYDLHPEQTVSRYEEAIAKDFPSYADVEMETLDSIIGGDEIAPEILEDPAAIKSLLDAANEEIAELELLFQESRLTKADFDPNLIKVLSAIESAEADTNDHLKDEHPKWTGAIDAWLKTDGRDQVGDEDEKAMALLSFYEDLTADVATERAGYEEERSYGEQTDQNTAHQRELTAGIAYYDGLLEVCNHRRFLALAGVEKDKLQRLYRLAA